MKTVGAMRRLMRNLTYTAAITLVTCPAALITGGAAAANPGASGPTRVALGAAMRQCDYSRTSVAPRLPAVSPPTGTGSALIHRAGSQAVAEVHLINPAQPGMHYDVGLIQAPRPATGSCGPGAPGTAFASLDLDAGGTGTVTVQDTVRQGTTGVWVIVERPNPNSQDPAEFYTSEFLVPM
ncbi:hypothetical protein I546_4780 [Mycobacterium kansasii 732]|uniref:Secreted protein n=2 Tax=Mycobacterium pseudokansasii TaxID=2341080 RepID=A0A498QWL8_9MYCO|nr:hypothetical protein I546_4780 [Mycobacterium kansasii 732]VBA56653.1 hypothetical protein LAUMK142_05628 [Mycobacterium pseudokansasii]